MRHRGHEGQLIRCPNIPRTRHRVGLTGAAFGQTERLVARPVRSQSRSCAVTISTRRPTTTGSLRVGVPEESSNAAPEVIREAAERRRALEDAERSGGEVHLRREVMHPDLVRTTGRAVRLAHRRIRVQHPPVHERLTPGVRCAWYEAAHVPDTWGITRCMPRYFTPSVDALEAADRSRAVPSCVADGRDAS